MPPPNDTISPDGIPAAGVIETGTGIVNEAVAETQQTTALPAETTAAEPEVDFNDFAGIKDAPLMSKEKDKPVAKPEEKEEVKVEDDKEVKEEHEEKVDPKTGKPVVAKIPRDYSGIPADMVPNFQRMGNEAFNAFKPIYLDYVKQKKELEELKKNPSVVNKSGIPDSYYEHPEAYTLTPEYTSAAQAAQESQLVLEHWREQLDNVRNGADSFVTLQRDPTSKQIVYGAPQKVDQRTQSYLESLFFNSNNQASQFQQKLGAVKDGYTQKHQALIGDIKLWEKNAFKVFEDDKHPLVPLYKDYLSKLPTGLKSNPLASPLAKAVVVIQGLMAEMQKNATTKSAVTTIDKKAAAQAKAGPTASGLSADTTPTKDEDVSFDDFQKVKEQ